MKSGRGRRGRPSKFGRPSRVVALTLPETVVRGLRKVHDDLAWAIVTLFEKEPPDMSAVPDAELISVGDGRWLIAVNRTGLKRLPGVRFVPIDGARALLALEPGGGMGDLELAVIDRLDQSGVNGRERQVLERLRSQLRTWRRNTGLRFYTRAIIEAERADRGGPIARAARSRTGAASDRRSPRTRR